MCEGFYSSRGDFIDTAIRNGIDRRAETVRQVTIRKSVHPGVRHFTHDELIRAQTADQTLDIRVLRLAMIAPDVSPELAKATKAARNHLVASDQRRGQAVLADQMT